MSFKYLFEPGNIGDMELKNRIVMAPMATLCHGPEGEILDKTVHYYAERARGGVGFIICQSSIIMRESRAPRRPSMYDDRFIPGLRRISDAVHQFGCRAAFQIVHHGRLLSDYRRSVDDPEELRVVAPSPVPRLLDTLGSVEAEEQHPSSLWVTGNEPPPQASIGDIKRITRGFAEAAARVKEAGFDAVEIHGAHGYLLSQFLSPLTNHRTDEYGGNWEKRARFACEVIEAVKQSVGKSFPVIFRFSGSDYLPGGISIQESQKQARLFVEAGADALHVSASEQATTDRQYPSFLFAQGSLVSLAEAIRKTVNVPVIAVGKIVDPRFAEQVLAAGQADFIALGRALLADPEWPSKAKDGRINDIRSCVYCLNCFDVKSHPEILRDGLHCSVNPALLKEKEFVHSPAATRKRVVVVGGGPAGMEAARVLAERGHRVTLFEQSDHLGGQWYAACQQPQKRNDYPKLLRYQEAGLRKAGARVELNTRVAPELVRREGPDAVVLATGAVPSTLNVRGADGPNVVQAVDVVLGSVKTGLRVVVIGGRLLGMEVADQLADEARHVSLLTRRSLGRDVEKNLYLTLRNRLISKGVQLFPNSPCVEIREDGVYMAFNNDLVFVEADTVVLAVGARPVNDLTEQLNGLVDELYQIGDCVQPRDVMWAIREGNQVGRMI